MLSSGDTYTNGDTGGEATHTLTIDEMPSHIHNTFTWRSTGGDWNAFNYLPDMNTSRDQNGSVAWDGYTSATGGSQAHNNMPPYLVVNIWKRLS